jgi:hypothetical protein
VTFDLFQLVLVVWTLAALGILLWSVQQGLLGTPDMQIAGNASSAEHLSWYADRAAGPLPEPWMISVPLLVYHLAMLAWALWLALSLLRGLRWGWESYTTGGGWRRLLKPRHLVPTAAYPPEPAAPPASDPDPKEEMPPA